MLSDELDGSAEPDVERLRSLWAILRDNPQEAIPGLEELAERGSVASMYFLANYYRFGNRTKAFSGKWDELAAIDLQKAEKWYRQAAEAGMVRGYYHLGIIYYNQMRFLEAKEAYEKAALGKFSGAMRLLAHMYFRGDGVEEDRTKARSLLSEAVELGNIRAMQELALVMRKFDHGFSRWLSIAKLYAKAFRRTFGLAKTKGDETIFSDEFR